MTGKICICCSTDTEKFAFNC